MQWIKFPVIVFTVWKSILTVYLIYFEPLLLPSIHSQTLNQRLYLAWVSRWDSVFYLDIAWKGYSFPNQAFFPLFPLLISLLNKLGLSIDISAFFLSQLFSLTAIIGFYLLGRKVLSEQQAQQAILMFICFPTVFFINAAYTEGLFLSLAIFSYYFFEKKKYYLSAIAGGLASATRVVGLAAGSQFLFVKSPRQRYLYMGISSIGIVVYMLYLQLTFHDPLIFIHSQKMWTQPHGYPRLMLPFEQVFTYPYQLLTDTRVAKTPILFVDWSLSLIFIALSIQVWKRLGPRYGLYSLLVVLIPLLSGNIMSMSRFVLTAFPVFLVLPLIIRNKYILYSMYIVCFGLQLLFISAFINNIWIG